MQGLSKNRRDRDKDFNRFLFIFRGLNN